MSWFRLPRRRSSAPIARQRLQILLAHERAVTGQRDLIAVLRQEILAAIAKHVRMDANKVRVKMERGDVVSTLEVEVEIPFDGCLAGSLGSA